MTSGCRRYANARICRSRDLRREEVRTIIWRVGGQRYARGGQQHQVCLVYIRDALVLDDERISKQRQVHLVLLLVQDERVL